VELKREAVEQRERALAEREEDLAQRERSVPDVVVLAFVPGTAYRLMEIEPAPLTPGSTFELGGAEYLVARLGPSPLPADDRRCAYLVVSSGGSS